jgi:UDP-N-acetylmuramyl pentapeptide phosphotransferase/UDP-N-acetylglucosamine-1-phosphate transferase
VTSTAFALALIWVLGALGLASWLVAAAIAYAQRRGMLDHPGQRRSHAVATPRGGGIGIVLAALITVPGALLTLPAAWPPVLVAALAGSLALVALIGWRDDHQPLGVLPRLGVQLLAVALFGAALLVPAHAWIWLPLLVLAGGWSINLHNFMDGIDELLAQQAIFVCAGLGILAASLGQPALATAALCIAAATIGFWRYNRSPARIFMGDVGSGSLGLLIAALVAMCWRQAPGLLWPALILCSSFVADASLTLLSRFLRGRRWYTAHREHLYQWLVRSGFTHAQSARFYLGWNLLIAAPAAALASSSPSVGLLVCFAIYTVAVATWIVFKRRCLRRNLHRARHVAT